MGFKETTLDDRSSPDMSDFLFGSKKKKKAAAAAATNMVAQLQASGQPLSTQAQQMAILASDGKISARDRKIIKKAGKQEQATIRRANVQDRKEKVGIAKATTNAIPKTDTPSQGTGISALEAPTKEAENPANAVPLSGGGGSISGGGGGGGSDMSSLDQWNDSDIPKDETKSDYEIQQELNNPQPEQTAKKNKNMIFILLAVAVVIFFIYKSKK